MVLIENDNRSNCSMINSALIEFSLVATTDLSLPVNNPKQLIPAPLALGSAHGFISELIKWQKEYENQGLQIIGITYPPTNRAKVRSFVRQNKINYPVLFGTKKTKALFDSGETMPFSTIIDKEGNIRERIEGIIFPEEFDEKVKPMLESSSEKKEIKAK